MKPDQVVGFGESNEVRSAVSANNAAAEKVFSNTLIWKIIGSYLNVGDLKACRLVNSEFHGMTMKETNFLQRCLVSLKPDEITMNIFGRTSELWKNVLLKFQSPGDGSYCNFSEEDLKNLDWLYPVISNVESLSLRMEKGTKGGNLFPLFKRLLSAPKRLRSLAVEPIYILCGTAGNFEEFKEILGNLDEFQILQPPQEWLLDNRWWVNIGPWVLFTDFIKQLENLRVLKGYYPLRIRPGSTPGFFTHGDILTSLLTRIAFVASRTLKHVTLGQASLYPENLLQIFQPGAITEFFEAMPMLQDLNFSLRLDPFPLEIINVIEHRSDRMQQVKLECVNFHGIKWEFLEKTKLQEFQLGLFYSDHMDCYFSTLPSEAQNHLPSTIRRLFLRGPLESNPVPALKRLNPTLVTELTFIGSGDCFGDDAIKYIRENLLMLRKLNVTNAKKVTDAGFMGSSSGSGSLSEIKGLRTLILRECGSITDATLKEIRFLELCYLDLAYNENLTENGFEGVLSRNSSLETLLTSCENVYHKREHLCASHPRLSSVVLSQLAFA